MPKKTYFTIGSDEADFGYILVTPRASNNVLRIALNPVILLIAAAIALGRLLWVIFVSQVLVVGQARYFLDGFKGQGSIGTLFSPYGRGEWLSIAGKCLL